MQITTCDIWKCDLNLLALRGKFLRFGSTAWNHQRSAEQLDREPWTSTSASCHLMLPLSWRIWSYAWGLFCGKGGDLPSHKQSQAHVCVTLKLKLIIRAVTGNTQGRQLEPLFRRRVSKIGIIHFFPFPLAPSSFPLSLCHLPHLLSSASLASSFHQVTEKILQHGTSQWILWPSIVNFLRVLNRQELVNTAWELSHQRMSDIAVVPPSCFMQRLISREKLYAPPSHVWAEGIFKGSVFEAPSSRIFEHPPLFYAPPTPWRVWGV